MTSWIWTYFTKLSHLPPVVTWKCIAFLSFTWSIVWITVCIIHHRYIQLSLVVHVEVCIQENDAVDFSHAYSTTTSGTALQCGLQKYVRKCLRTQHLVHYQVRNPQCNDLTSPNIEVCQNGQSCVLHNWRSAGLSPASADMVHITSSAGVNDSATASYFKDISTALSRHATFLVCAPTLHVLEQSLHSLTFHTNSITGLWAE